MEGSCLSDECLHLFVRKKYLLLHYSRAVKERKTTTEHMSTLESSPILTKKFTETVAKGNLTLELGLNYTHTMALSNQEH